MKPNIFRSKKINDRISDVPRLVDLVFYIDVSEPGLYASSIDCRFSGATETVVSSIFGYMLGKSDVFENRLENLIFRKRFKRFVRKSFRRGGNRKGPESLNGQERRDVCTRFVKPPHKHGRCRAKDRGKASSLMKKWIGNCRLVDGRLRSIEHLRGKIRR